jgi:hypothetical protein
MAEEDDSAQNPEKWREWGGRGMGNCIAIVKKCMMKMMGVRP